MEVINPSILAFGVDRQIACPLFCLPAEIQHRILLAAITTKAATPCITTRLMISLTCKKLAHLLPVATENLSGTVPGIYRTGQLVVNNIPKKINANSSTAVINARAKFMIQLGLWLQPKDGWAFCSVCLVYKKLGGGLGAEKESWRSMKKGGSNKGDLEGGPTIEQTTDHLGRPMYIFSDEVIAGPKKELKDQTEIAKKGGWSTIRAEEHLVCPKHRFTVLQMVKLGQK